MHKAIRRKIERCSSTATAPSIPPKLAHIVSSGAAIIKANTLGTVTYSVRLKPITARASISSPTFIVPISAANAEPERPARRSRKYRRQFARQGQTAAGLEIDNPKLVSSGDTGTLDWIENGEEPENSEFRDDRFDAAIERASDDSPVFTVADEKRATTPRRHGLLQAYVEDMYNPSRYGRTGTGRRRGSSPAK